ncbi:GGDEF domain-containing protein [Bacillus tianshenii]|uniref:GGDEF domain-containing protein n=1 Tax=Sutcliffiella tianshenii TaxID=1463404 RepID=UPI001CD5A354|nr:GGDEF domain-containing protein [Bacillus tianshenii]MCA1319074.1 GGDEF domain-containing protein [Bacillus tianshenii]
MNSTIRKSDHHLEISFFLLRWLFLISAPIVFYFLHQDAPAFYDWSMFGVLWLFGFIYMAVTQAILHMSKQGTSLYFWNTKGGVIFDFVAFIWLIAITGGVYSPLFPIAYLIILHVAIYWELKGAVLFSFLLSIGTTFITIIGGTPFSTNLWLVYSMNQLFMLLMGLLGGFLVTRERKHYFEKRALEEVAKMDYLTNLRNHRSFQETLQNYLHTNQHFWLVLADLDRFKCVNDKYGHEMGDQVLAKVGSVLDYGVEGYSGTAFRYGGEEFSILFKSSDRDQVAAALKELKDKIENLRFLANENEFSISMSFGCVECTETESSNLVKMADDRLYEAKRAGRNTIIMNKTWIGTEQSHLEREYSEGEYRVEGK